MNEKAFKTIETVYKTSERESWDRCKGCFPFQFSSGGEMILHEQKKKYTGFVFIENCEDEPIIKFQYTPYPGSKPLFISRSRRVAEFIKRLKPDINEITNAYALTETKWQKAIIFAVSVKFFKDVKTLNRFADFLLELDSLDLLYWYDHIRRFIEFPEYRDRVVKAMLTLFDFDFYPVMQTSPTPG